MSSLLTSFGLRAASPTTPISSYTAHYIILNFIFAYAALSSRGLKNAYKLDHNVSPREDVFKYGERAVASGKITQEQLNMLKRNEGAHANAAENFPMFVGSLL
ncbi:uncharacterized protein BDZ99DRAFT_459370 [Mytilinidion resinicola]|uniref:Uncharacterized protein n=1 Tax=Mytilinidion resinicola TaxID=574789 RepID=A0A6A6Z456_9PEZI|nr:uncharacterized protein BDZ99DRAFT_459370 [Mytilinidion resinicola]KAF2815519.1 hypothetical protein BDZ99DRAFT_459370 [Mytilinidion resinicola]